MSQPNELLLPIAEHFHSYQGEGQWTGTPMHFIRIAGCSVGLHPDTDSVKYEIGQDRDFPILKTGRPAYRCHTYDGRGFWCDTDFQKGHFLDMTYLVNETWEKHICVTGGEPFLLRDKLQTLMELAAEREIVCHIETSGTIEWLPTAWITVSPKQGWLPIVVDHADEIKLLIDKGFRLEDVPALFIKHPTVYIQPINDELHINLDNLNLCYNILRQMPTWRLSVQLHKCFGWR